MDIRSIDLNLLVVLEALLLDRNVTRAAKRVGLSQSATSSALGRLRDLFQDPLLVRTSEGMVPTQTALALMPDVLESLKQVRSIFEEKPRFNPATSTRTFAIVATDFMQMLLASKLAKTIEAKAPGIEISFKIPTGSIPTLAMQKGEIDLAFAPYADSPQGIYRQTLFSDRLVSITREDHPTIGKKISLSEYLKLNHVVVSFSGDRKTLVDEELAKKGLRRKITAVVPYLYLALQLVAETDMIATMPSRLVELHKENLGLKVLPPPIQSGEFVMYQLWHERTHSDDANSWLRSIVKNLLT